MDHTSSGLRAIIACVVLAFGGEGTAAKRYLDAMLATAGHWLAAHTANQFHVLVASQSRLLSHCRHLSVSRINISIHHPLSADGN